jgi:DNA-binding beta-propeller fold protein YncE
MRKLSRLAPLALSLCTSFSASADDREPTRTDLPTDTRTSRPAWRSEIDPLPRPGEVEFDKDLGLLPTERLFVTYPYDSRITVIDPATGNQKDIVAPDVDGFEAVAVSTVHRRIYAASAKAGELFVFDLDTHALVDHTILPTWNDGQEAHPHTLTLEPGEGLLFIGDQKTPAVRCVDATDVSATVEVILAYGSGRADTMAFRPGSLDLTLGSFTHHNLGTRHAYLDLQTLTMWFDWSKTEFGMQGGPEQQGTIGFDWAGKDQLLLVGNAQVDYLLVIDPATGYPFHWVATNAMPMRLAVDPFTQASAEPIVYVPTGQGWTLDVFAVAGDTTFATLSTVTSIPDVCTAGIEDAEDDSPNEVVFSTVKRRAYVLCGDRVRVIDSKTHAIAGEFELAATWGTNDVAIAAW